MLRRPGETGAGVRGGTLANRESGPAREQRWTPYGRKAVLRGINTCVFFSLSLSKELLDHCGNSLS